MKGNCRRCCSAFLVLSLSMLLPAVSQAREDGKVIPPTARYHGLSYSEWIAKWNQAAISIPVVDGNHPVFSGSLFGKERGVRFLSGLTGGVTLEVSIPMG